jgi:uncharacterized membrane protein
MIWFILIYVITLILHIVFIYFDMDKGETLNHYFQGMDTMLFIVVFLIPVFNTVIVIILALNKFFEKIWDKIKYWQK